MTTLHIAVYCRKSVDRSDLAVSVSVQEKACRKYAAERWDLPVIAYVDNDLSAANPAVVRPQFRAMVDAIRAGRVAQVVVREQSRLTRQVDEWESLCRTLQLAGIDVVHLTHGSPIPVTEGSRLPGRIVAVVDAEYVEQTRIRVRNALATFAEEGRPHARAGYGYRSTVGVDGRPALEPHPDTAPIVEQMVTDVAQGMSLGAVAGWLNAEGIPTPAGAKQWRRESVRAIVTAPRLVGLRRHHRALSAAQWPAIVDRGLWDQAQARLAQGRPGRTVDQRRAYLLRGGLAVCDGCGTALISGTMNREPAYICPHPSRPEGGCGHCAILADRLEPHVLATIGGWLTDPGLLAEMNRHLAAGSENVAPLRAELADVDSQLAILAERWAGGGLLELEHAAARRVLIERRSRVLSDLEAQPVVEVLTPEDVQRAWKAAETAGDTPRLRALVGVLAKPVRVARAHQGRRLATAERATVLPAWN